MLPFTGQWAKVWVLDFLNFLLGVHLLTIVVIDKIFKYFVFPIRISLIMSSKFKPIN